MAALWYHGIVPAPLALLFAVSDSVGFLWTLILKRQGVLSLTLMDWGWIDQPIQWLTEPFWTMFWSVFVYTWAHLGFYMLILLAGLQAIPKDLYEAATMDGAGRFQQFWYITLPGLRPMIFFGVTLSVIGGLQLFEEPFILTGGRGGSDQAGMTTAIYLYRMAFDFNDFGAASAMSWLLFLVVVALTWLTNRAFRPRGGGA